jgi:hypothetical protein
MFCARQTSLQEDCKAEKDAAKKSSQTQTSVGHEERASAVVVVAAVAAAAAGGLGTTETSDWNGVAGGTRWLCGGGHGGGERSVTAVGLLGTAWVILTAGALAGRVIATVFNAVVSPLLADEERQGLGVFGNVWGDAVVADAVVGQVVGITVI